MLLLLHLLHPLLHPLHMSRSPWSQAVLLLRNWRRLAHLYFVCRCVCDASKPDVLRHRNLFHGAPSLRGSGMLRILRILGILCILRPRASDCCILVSCAFDHLFHYSRLFLLGERRSCGLHFFCAGCAGCVVAARLRSLFRSQRFLRQRFLRQRFLRQRSLFRSTRRCATARRLLVQHGVTACACESSSSS